MIAFRKVFPVLFMATISLSVAAQDTTEHVLSNRKNSIGQQQKPYVILISADGFRYDFAEKYQAKNLLKLSADGVRAKSMIPSYPSLTFPNHYSIITGMYPAHHGLVDNSFYEPADKKYYKMSNAENVHNSKWYGGVPLWVLAEQQHMLTASYYWVGSETKIDGLLSTHYYTYNEKTPVDLRVEKVKEWLKMPAETRPHFITFYFPEVDHEAHLHGPDSKEAEKAVHFVDESIGELVKKVAETGLKVNFIFVSDHGMTTVDAEHTIRLPSAVDTSKFIVPGGDALLHLYAKNKTYIKPTYIALKNQAKDFDVYLAKNIPAKWHYSSKDDRYKRIGDILLVPHLPYVFSLSGKKTTPGKHGFDPAIPDMQATFYAWGPAFKTGYKTGSFENIHVYPLVAHILGLPYQHKIDGKFKVLKGALN